MALLRSATGPARTRLLILHGPTGSGKTSFLRAGLLPALEESPRGYYVPRTAHDQSSNTGGLAPALFVRSTARPLSEVARAVFLLAAPDFSFDFVSGRHRVDLSEARLGTTDAISFERQVGRSPERLIEAIGLLARTLPSTLVLVVDQAEEMFTLEPGETGLQARDAFFDFLTLLGETPTDLRLIVSLRTEYFGHFAHQVYHRDLDAESLREYLLLDLDAKGLQQAILRPTESISIGPFVGRRPVSLRLRG